MISKGRDDPNWAFPTSGQVRGAFWLSVVAAIGFWVLYASMLADRGFSQSVLALWLPLLTTYGAASLYFKNKWLFRRGTFEEGDR